MSPNSDDSLGNLVNDVQAMTLELPATTAVLNINELLHLILAEVPCEYRVNLRRVSKAWSQALSKLGFVLEPVQIAFQHMHPNWDGCIPEYALGDYLHIDVNETVFDKHPRKSRRSCIGNLPDRLYCSNEDSDGSVPLQTHSQANRFATNPPISTVALVTHAHNYLRYETLAILRIRDGIRVRDLKKHLAKLGRDWPGVYCTARFLERKGIDWTCLHGGTSEEREERYLHALQAKKALRT